MTLVPSAGSNQFVVRPPEYLESFAGFDMDESFAQILAPVREVMERLDDKPLVVCDAMCGTGKVGRFLREVLKDDLESVTFADGSELMLAAISVDSRDRIVRCFSEDMPFDDGAFPVITSRYGINNVEKKQYVPVLQEYLRVLAADGLLIIQDHFPKDPTSRDLINAVELFIAKEDGRNDNPYIPDVEEFEGMVEESGGVISSSDEHTYSFSILDRFSSKGKTDVDLSDLYELLAGFEGSPLFERKGDDVIFHYPITTFTINHAN